MAKGMKNPSFRFDFKNAYLISVKIAPNKSFSQKSILPIENLLEVPKNS
jgi:hypothetical protein